MLEDTVRNEAYRKAIFDNKEVFRGKKVLDIGAGTGILSVFCAQAGAALVYAVEASKMYKLAEEIVEENNFKEVIKVIHGAIEDVSLPNDEKVDIIISEWMGHLVLHEGMLDSVIKARDKFLRPNGLIFPENVTLYSAPCQVPSLNEDWENVSGVSMVSFCKELRSKCLNSPLIVSVKPEHLLSEPEIILWLDLREVTIGDINCNKIQHLAVVDKPGRYQEPVVLSTHPEEPITHWKQTIVVLPINLLVEIGEPLAYEIIFERSILDNRKYCLKVEMLDVDEVPHPEYCNCFKTKCILAKAILEKGVFIFVMYIMGNVKIINMSPKNENKVTFFKWYRWIFQISGIFLKEKISMQNFICTILVYSASIGYQILVIPELFKGGETMDMMYELSYLMCLIKMIIGLVNRKMIKDVFDTLESEIFVRNIENVDDEDKERLARWIYYLKRVREIVPIVKKLDCSLQLPGYAVVLSRSTADGVDMEHLDQLQQDFEKLLFTTARRCTLLKSEIECLDEDEEKRKCKKYKQQ
ncbi:hypothetical protein FQA39_LY10770 [Lamprigera yunnana]|nr:hypothetical protein FQA39_LY10770 [Lamprigera yunnana]